mmetsp:Transcript_60434/g.152979  ORF Transcript_60434/g.152979 Transcript_60434/m.152979 type:complete len:223 (+) Transcript_60434:234-902(+)
MLCSAPSTSTTSESLPMRTSQTPPATAIKRRVLEAERGRREAISNESSFCSAFANAPKSTGCVAGTGVSGTAPAGSTTDLKAPRLAAGKSPSSASARVPAIFSTSPHSDKSSDWQFATARPCISRWWLSSASRPARRCCILSIRACHCACRDANSFWCFSCKPRTVSRCCSCSLRSRSSSNLFLLAEAAKPFSICSGIARSMLLASCNFASVASLSPCSAVT